jgi:hypothetical protein
MRFLLFCVFTSVLDVSTFFAQNLLSNGQFETISQCPTDQGQINNVLEWIKPTSGDADLYNTCSTFGYFSLPTNGLGYQEDGFGGVSYVGLYAYSIQDTNISKNVREYIQTQLISSLNTCSIYKVSFYVSLIDSSHYAVNSIGAFVGDSAIHRNDFYSFSYYEPQVCNPKTRMLADKENWSKIEGKFIANGGERYITIGNFDLDNELDTLATNNNLNSTYAFAYYYIDNVSLTLFSDSNTNIIAGNDTMVAPGDSIFIGQEVKGLNCTWRTLDGTFIADSISGIYVQPAETTTYVVEQNLCGTITYDTITVYAHPVGLKESLAEALEASEIVIYPNPNNGNFEIKNPNKEKLIFELKNALGQVVYTEKIEHEKHLINLNLAKGGALSLSKGVYFATFNTANGRFEEKIVIK